MLARRLPIAFALAFVLNGLTFWTLWALINVHIDAKTLGQAAKIEFTRLRRDTDVATIKREKPKLEKPVAQPSTPQVTRATFSRTGTEAIAPNLLSAPSIDTKGSLSMGTGLSIGGMDQDVMPLVQIHPEYPPRAQSRGVEGWVLVQFTITPTGTVADAKVVDAQPKGVFDDAAVKAVSRWKYNPKVEGGAPVERRGVQVKLTFKLQA